jgi:hypothetical protein
VIFVFKNLITSNRLDVASSATLPHAFR